MKKLSIILILCSYTTWLSSQVVEQGNGTTRIVSSRQSKNTSNDKEEAFDVSIRCYYTFTQANKATGKIIRIDTMALLIGNNQSKFYNPAKYARDSTFVSIMQTLNPSTIRSISVMKDANIGDLSDGPGETSSTDSNDGESYQIIKDRNTNSLSYVDYVGMQSDTYGYDDKLKLSWQINQDTTSILGYPCLKATVDFRGRTYTAWFSTDIPINDGPWKFMGLPGLILKISDTNNLFRFEMIGVENIAESTSIRIPKIKYECNRKQFEGMKKKQSGGMQININGGNIIIAQSPGNYNYNPIELDLN
ncbi:MAG: GLPGLI family protein [Dysgonamonadaceae bacterium]|jgi:GLPGLI family protein|nr:GLPGLI family protein [Dysgonamonadaceae bacterium]